ncbi:MAG: hypothetical protein V1663_05825 [archaeon]
MDNLQKEQEEQIAKASILNKKNLYKLLVILRDMYPAGYTYNNLKEISGIKILPKIQLKELIDESLLKLYDVPEIFKQNFPEARKKFPQYMITKEGMEFLNNIEVCNLTKSIKYLTKILIWVGSITIILMLIQLGIQILQNLKTL